MKKFLCCIVFLIAFSGITSIVLNANGFDGENRQIKSEITSYQELTSEEIDDINADISDKANNSGKTKVVYDVVLFEFSDYNNYFTDKRLKEINELFNDDDASNSTYSVNEYFKDMSYGKVEMNANIYLYKDSKAKSYYDNPNSNFVLEYATYQRAKIKSKSIYNNYGEGNASMIIFSSATPKTNDTRLWAHAYSQSTFVSLTYGHADVETLCHEILHTFGIKDLYTYDTSLPYPVQNWDISASGNYYSNNLMYNKLNLGWVDVSNYEDDKETEIETITQNGTYTLTPTTSTNGTRAYKFGMKKGDEKVYFIAEYRKESATSKLDSYQPEGLIVYRVNENKKFQGNLQATSYKDFEIYVYRKNERYTCNYSSFKSGYCGSLTDSSYYLYYDDKTIAKYIIENITINDETNTLTFTFKNYSNSTNYIAGKVYKTGTKALANAEVRINGIKRTTTNSSGEFFIENINSQSTLSIITDDESLIYVPVIVNPGETNIKVYADEVSYARVRITDGQASDTYTVYKYTSGDWTKVGSFSGNVSYYVIPNARMGEKYKVVGNLVDEEFIISNSNAFKYIKKQEPKEEESKSSTEKITDAITSIPGKVKDTLKDTYDTIKDSVKGALDELGRLLGF